MKWVFKIDVLRHCPHCAGSLRFIPLIFDLTAIEAIIAAVLLADERAQEARAQATSRGPPRGALADIVAAPERMRQAT